MKIRAAAAKSTYTHAPAYHQGTYLFSVVKCHKSQIAWQISPKKTKKALPVCRVAPNKTKAINNWRVVREINFLSQTMEKTTYTSAASISKIFAQRRLVEFPNIGWKRQMKPRTVAPIMPGTPSPVRKPLFNVSFTTQV